MKYLIGAIVMIVIMWISASMVVYVISGCLMFAGIVVLVESIPFLRWLFVRTGNLVDLLLFGLSIYGLSEMGVTVAIGLSIAGLLFSVYYKPLLKQGKKK